MATVQSASSTKWAGWLFFAASLMMLGGFFEAISGLTALLKDSVYAVNDNQLLVFDYTQWGVVHLVLGIVLIAAAAAMFTGKLWGRIVGIAIVTLNAVTNFMFLQAYPVWSLIAIFVDVFILYAIAVHGDELREE